ncbi:hypothetical protein GCM10022243_17300 [Saccharothrix violaceirubra]
MAGPVVQIGSVTGPVTVGARPVEAVIPVAPVPPPRPDLVLGRDAEVGSVVSGGPGIGKSTLLAAALDDPLVVGVFGARRFVVSCEGAASADAVVDKAAVALGVPVGEHLRNRVLGMRHVTTRTSRPGLPTKVAGQAVVPRQDSNLRSRLRRAHKIAHRGLYQRL